VVRQSGFAQRIKAKASAPRHRRRDLFLRGSLARSRIQRSLAEYWVMGDGLDLDAWWDEPAYKAAQGAFAGRGTFILVKLQAHDAAKLKDVLVTCTGMRCPDLLDREI
jgi:hypothetical protein